MTQTQFDVKALIDGEVGSHAQALCQIHHSQNKPCQREAKKVPLAARVGEAAKPSSLSQTVEI